MELSNEDKVTSLLSNKEILKKQDITYVSNVNDMNSFREYDLSLYIKTHKAKPLKGRFESKYLFVK